MIERLEKTQTADGAMEVFTVRPDGSGPFPVVVEIMDALGMREELHDHARRIARLGYYVVVPDFFYRSNITGPLDLSDPATLPRIRAAMAALTDALATRDLEDALKVAQSDPAAATGKLGLYGFCMGGRLALVLCERLGDRVAAAASIHPGGLVTDQPNSPHRHLEHVTAQIYFGIADQDQTATPEQMAELETALRARHVSYTLEWHPGAKHGFMMPSRQDVYHEDAARKAWQRIEALFARTLT